MKQLSDKIISFKVCCRHSCGTIGRGVEGSGEIHMFLVLCFFIVFKSVEFV